MGVTGVKGVSGCVGFGEVAGGERDALGMCGVDDKERKDEAERESEGDAEMLGSLVAMFGRGHDRDHGYKSVPSARWSIRGMTRCTSGGLTGTEFGVLGMGPLELAQAMWCCRQEDEKQIPPHRCENDNQGLYATGNFLEGVLSVWTICRAIWRAKAMASVGLFGEAAEDGELRAKLSPSARAAMRVSAVSFLLPYCLATRPYGCA